MAMRDTTQNQSLTSREKQQRASSLLDDALHGGVLELPQFLYQTILSRSHIYAAMDYSHVEEVFRVSIKLILVE